MTVVSIGLRAEAELQCSTARGVQTALRLIREGEDPRMAYSIARCCEHFDGPELEDIAYPRPEREETPVEIVLVNRWRE